MNELQESLATDIGSGMGEYFVERARQQLEKTFLILEPRRLRILRKPPNLRIVQWRTDRDSKLPLSPNSVNEVNINFLAGDIVYREDDNDNPEFPVWERYRWERYRKLLHDLKGVLKKGALVRIVDDQGHIKEIEKMLEEEGYRITLPAARLQDEKRTSWTKTFFSRFKETRRFDLLPMTVEAQWPAS